jgi:plastocyanin
VSNTQDSALVLREHSTQRYNPRHAGVRGSFPFFLEILMRNVSMCGFLCAFVLVFAPIACEKPNKEAPAAGDTSKSSSGETPPSSDSSSSPAVSAAPPAGTATIRGVIKYAGAPKPAVDLLMTADPYCATANPTAPKSEHYVVGPDNSLANVFVAVSKGVTGRYPPAKDPVLLDQKSCIYQPHVVGLQVGQELRIANNDKTLHNVNLQPKVNDKKNQGQAAGTPPISIKFKRPEENIPVKCDVHPWMSAVINVVEHPFFAVSGADGKFEIATKLPAGKYTLRAVHDRAGVVEKEIEVADGQTVDVELEVAIK